MKPASANFDFLRPQGEQFVRLAAQAEHYFRTDPNTSMIKLRQFAELLAKEVAARTGSLRSPDESFADVLGLLGRTGYASHQALDLFHYLRKAGNEAVHGDLDDFAAALAGLKVARELAAWFVRSYGGSPKLALGPFTPPAAPADPAADLLEELDQLRAEAETHRSAAEIAHARAEALALENLEATERLRREAEERSVWQKLAEEAEASAGEVRAALEATQRQAAKSAPAELAKLEKAAEVADAAINLDEAATRAIIDQQLERAGWEADTRELRYAKGARPIKGRNLAIAEWPTASGPADYALFAGLTLVGVVEAKRQNRNVMSVLPQAERYAEGIFPGEAHLHRKAPWGAFKAPFVFSTNGRPYLKQLQTASGIWRRDLRRPTNPASALMGWPSPAGLLERLEADQEAAEAALETQGFNFGFDLRPYQRRAIEAVEKGLSESRSHMLIGMATGTGKTKLAIAMLYRLIAAKRFRSVCFVVDRSALGDQTEREFTTTKVVAGKAFAEIFGLKGLGDVTPDPETRIHICTIQGLVRRTLFADDPANAPTVDQYDLMVIDECHRGYLLDREMSDAELSFRDQDDYVSKYRRVLDYFDATKIGLTATPALHTVEIFGEPVFRYSYREAVIDGYLIDYEPPIRITTTLSKDGIHFVAEEEVTFVHAPTGQVEMFKLPDSLDFDVESFNRTVITEAFNRAVADELTRHIDLSEPDKTLVFAASDAHADIVVKALRDAFRAAHGDIEDLAIRKLTGSVDKVGKLILEYRNDALPKIAVTVDLLTTGIDVPKITNLVFLRRVNSRILYEQMIGRATRLCPEIGKETFRIFDAVDLYSRLQALTEMRPVAADPNLTLTQLLEELAKVEDARHRADVRDQIIVRLNRRLKRLPAEARAKAELAAGETPEDTLARFRAGDADELAEWVRKRPGLGPALDWQTTGGTPVMLPISEHPDEVVDVSRGYGEAERPEDYLDAFTAFIRANVNQIAALTTVVQRPRDLTRAQLRDLRLQLDAQGFTDANIRRAWSDARNEDIAASIIGYVRQAALGDPLIPYSDRVRRAVDTVARKGNWSDVQKRWLHRIGEQLQKEIVVDRQSLDEEPFKSDGGFRVIDKRFGGRLEEVLSDLSEELWRTAS
ncbi:MULTISPECIES: type I restriction-modification system endonuclease [unclassified Brevundimonas]|jgi:type I restriction enzyme R subunit|uniref:type I restriction-modification system endonuclease n=1 Tax=unclassified Brevundimonas TaxID=2622653 RepID=UPI000C43D141|nr:MULTISPECIES: type I restriction-modification system endonuclease [unclassified Brevundimonas]MAL89160.1 type I restriction-modification system endonuclease [Brevundimonas sp.]|tara:strand:+ start:16196 stop:19579 length:3384 start_codon:yes stop_codon:yes gene_type:complete